MTTLTALNGRLDTALLVSVGGGQALRADAAAAWLGVVAEVRARFGISLVLTDSYRPYAVQVQIFNERYDPASSGSGPFGDVRWWGGVRYVRMRGASAAVPGTSNHGLGVAVDVTGLGGFSGTTYARLAAVAPAHGWSNASGRTIDEAWHWEYSPAADNHPTPAPSAVQEDEMRIIAQTERGIWLMGAGFAHHFTPEEWSQFQQYPHGLTVTTIPAGGAGQVVFDMHRTIYTKQAHA